MLDVGKRVAGEKFGDPEEGEEMGENSLMIARIKNESVEQRAERILAQMRDSTARLDRVLSVFDRLSN